MEHDELKRWTRDWNSTLGDLVNEAQPWFVDAEQSPDKFLKAVATLKGTLTDLEMEHAIATETTGERKRRLAEEKADMEYSDVPWGVST